MFADWILDTKGEVSFERLVISLARELGLTVKGLKKGYKRLRRIYDEEMEFIKKLKQMRERSCTMCTGYGVHPEKV
jgi:hypothetical protein